MMGQDFARSATNMHRTTESDDIALLPGRYFIGGRGCRMQTVLGTGVVVTLWHRALQTGAMAHFLPAAESGEQALELNGHAAWDGLQLVLRALQWSQANAADCVARVCGSGKVMTRTDHVPSLNAGQAAGEFMRRLLRACGLPIVSESFYAAGRYRICFNAGNGRVHARRIKPVIVALDSHAQSAAPQLAMAGRRRAGAGH